MHEFAVNKISQQISSDAQDSLYSLRNFYPDFLANTYVWLTCFEFYLFDTIFFWLYPPVKLIFFLRAES